MFDRELTGLILSDKKRLQSLLESSIRDLLETLEESPTDPNKIVLKCANIRAVFKLASVFRQTTSTDR